MSKLVNIVFYKFNGEDNNKVQACLFYNDGTVKNVSYNEALEESKKIAKEEKSLGKDSFNELLNNKRIFVMSGEELTRRFDDFVVNDNIKDAIDAALDSIALEEDKNKVLVKKQEEVKNTNTGLVAVDTNINKDTKPANVIVFDNKVNNDTKDFDDDKNSNKGFTAPLYVKSDDSSDLDNDLEEDLEDEDLDEISTEEVYEELDNMDNTDEVVEEKEEKVVAPVEEKEEGFFTRIKNKVKGKFVPYAVAAALVFGIGGAGAYALSQTPKDGIMNDTKIETEAEVSDNGNDDEVVVNYANRDNVKSASTTQAGDNSKYTNYTYKQLLEVTTNAKQKEVMQNMSIALDYFNGEFADKYVEEGKDIRAALSWDEMMALQMAYNDYSKEEIHAIFNGAEVSSNDLENAYKNATLQLMGAYVIEREGALLDVTKFVHSEEGIKFVQKYQNLLERAKNTKGEEQLRAVEAFYSELYKDFPITEEVRTEGISHADKRTIESYKLAVAPMVAAAEMMFQNLEVDHTLTDQAIAYFNDLGLCNLAQDKFDRIETITLACCQSDKENPLYDQFRLAKIKELVEKGIYVIDDEHRDLSRLDRFQELVNGHFQMVDGHFCLSTWYTTETWTESHSWTESHTKTWTETTRTETSDRDKAVKEAGEKKVKEAEDRVNEQIRKENEKNKKKGEEEAKKNQEEMQKKADEEKKKQEEEVKKDDEDLQKEIDNANEKIDEGQTVNEDDFKDHNVDFDKDHSDDKGNLDESVKDLTTDGKDADKELVDPNESGKEFDKHAPEYDGGNEYDVVDDGVVDKTDTNSNDNTEDNQNNNNDNNNNDNGNSGSDSDSGSDLGDPNDTGSSFDSVSDDNDNDYEIVYDDEIDDSEDKKEESKPEVKEEKHESKPEVKEEKHESTPEVKEEKHESAPKQESAPEPKHESAPEPKHESAPEPKQESAPEVKEEKHEEESSNEAKVNDYVEKLASADTNEDAKTLVKS